MALSMAVPYPRTQQNYHLPIDQEGEAQARGCQGIMRKQERSWLEKGDTYPLTRKGHLRVRGDGKFGKSLGCLCLPNISPFQGQREQSLPEQSRPC